MTVIFNTRAKQLFVIFVATFVGFISMSIASAAPTSGSKGASCEVLNAVADDDAGCDNGSAERKVGSVIQSVVEIISAVAGIIAVIMIIVGGLKYITSNGDPNAITAAKRTIIYAIVGLVVAASAQVIVHFVLARSSSGADTRELAAMQVEAENARSELDRAEQAFVDADDSSDELENEYYDAVDKYADALESVDSANNKSEKHKTKNGSGTIGKQNVNNKKFDFTLTQYNLKHALNWRGCPGGTDKRALECVAPSATAQARFIKGNHDKSSGQVSLVTMNEVSQPQYAKLKELLPDYGYFPNMVPPYRGKALMWNKAVFDLVSSDQIERIYDNAGDMGTAPSIKLRAKSNGQIVYAMSIHSPNNGHGTAAQRKHNAERLADWSSSKIKSDPDALIVIGGDFNDGPDAGTGNWAYCILGGADMRNVYDVWRGNAGKCPTNTRLIPIDQLYISKNVKASVGRYRYFPHGRSIGTDHGPLLTRLTVTKD